MDMTTNTATARHIDANQAVRHMSPARFELGIRNYKTSGSAVWFQIGCGRSTSWVELTINAADLYDVVVFQLRGTKRTELGRLEDVFAGDLARTVVAEWCTICDRKGW